MWSWVFIAQNTWLYQSSGLGWCIRCEVQDLTPNMNLLGLPPLSIQGTLVSFVWLRSYGSSWSFCTQVGPWTQWVGYYYGHTQIELPCWSPPTHSLLIKKKTKKKQKLVYWVSTLDPSLWTILYSIWHMFNNKNKK